MQLRLKLFSSLMEYLPPGAEGNSVSLNLAGDVSCHDLIDRYSIPRNVVQVVMVNGEYVSTEDREKSLSEGDTISVWPSIQGG